MCAQGHPATGNGSRRNYQPRTARNFRSKGFLHGFLTLTDDCEVQYKCSDYYAPECDGAVRWDSVGIDWGTDAPVLSDKDAQAVAFTQFETPFQYEG